MTLCCYSSTVVETSQMEELRPESAVFSAQQQRLRNSYSSPMRPSQYTRAPGDAARAIAVPRETTIRLNRDRASIEQVLLGRRWLFHSVSPLFHFRRDQLSEYAHDLVKTMRAAALRAYGQQFGYNVSIHDTNTIVAFQISEVRDQRQSRATKKTVAQKEFPGRTGSFVLYFSTDKEQYEGRERKKVLLQSGDEELMGWVCSWLQRHFQCLVSSRCVRMHPLSLKKLARSWVVASLLAEEERPVSIIMKSNKQESVENSIGSCTAPLLLHYRATNEMDVVRTYTMIVPWAMLHRLFQQTKDGPDGTCTSTYIPELIELVERLYLGCLPFDLSTYKIERVEMKYAAIDHDGGLEFYSTDLVQTVFFSLLELLAVPTVALTFHPETIF